jgi:hypothetical protein
MLAGFERQCNLDESAILGILGQANRDIDINFHGTLVSTIDAKDGAVIVILTAADVKVFKID